MPSSMYPCTPFVLPLIYSQFGFSIFPPTLPCSSPRQQSSVMVHHCGAGAAPGGGEHRGVRNRHMQRERTCVPSGIQPEEGNKGCTKTGERREPDRSVDFGARRRLDEAWPNNKNSAEFFYAFGSLIIPDTPFISLWFNPHQLSLFSGSSPRPQYHSRPTVISGVTSPYFRVSRRVPSTIRGLPLFQALRRFHFSGFSPRPQYHSRPTVISGVTSPYFRVSRRVPSTIRGLLLFQALRRLNSGFLAASPVPFAAYCCFGRYVASILGFLAASPVPFAAYCCFRRYVAFIFGSLGFCRQLFLRFRYPTVTVLRPHYISRYSFLLCGPRL